jgi:hypothetical protein
VKRAGLLAAMLGAVLATGCLVEVRHVSNPGRAFDQARAEAARVAGRPGPAHQLNVLVFDPDDEKLVRVSVPLWLARKIARHGTDEIDFDDDEVSAHVRERLRHRVKLEEIEKAGLGTLVEVEDDDGTQILVWLR